MQDETKVAPQPDHDLNRDTHSNFMGGALQLLGGFGLLAVVLYVLWVGKNVLQPLFIAAFLVMILNALSNLMVKIKIKGRNLPYSIAFTIALVIALGGLFLMAEIIIGNVNNLTLKLPEYQENFNLLTLYFLKVSGMSELPSLNDLIQQISLRDIMTQLLAGFTEITGNLFTIILFVIFILMEKASMHKKLIRLNGISGNSGNIQRSLQKVSRMMDNYIGAKTLISLATALLSYGLMKFIGLDYPGFWALLIFILNFIPYIGSILGTILPILLSILQFADPTPIIWTAGGLLAIQVIMGNFIEPKFMGHSLNISPLIILLTLALFGTLWGIIGMFLSVPLTVIALVVFAQSPHTRILAILISSDGEIESLYQD